MSEEDFSVVCRRIDEEKGFLNSVSRDIWMKPELGYEERHAHDTLTVALAHHGFVVQKSYLLPTAFKAEFSSESDGGPVVAVLLEYDALPSIGHACGHNLIAECGLAASLGIKAAMEADLKLVGKLIVLGSPAEEGGGGKIDLMNAGALESVDVAMMAHPCKFNVTNAPVLSRLRMNADFKGKEAHASAFPWEGRNALDAAVAAYQNMALLRQQIRPSNRIHAILTKGGVVPNIIPSESRLEMYVRAATKYEMMDLTSRVTDCIQSGASSTGCTVCIEYDYKSCYENLVTNKVMGNVFDTYAQRLGIHPTDFAGSEIPLGSTDMGNVSHVVPSIHPFYNINTEAFNHTKEFTEASGSPEAQGPTLQVAKALAMTALKCMRCPQTLKDTKKQFEFDLAKGL